MNPSISSLGREFSVLPLFAQIEWRPETRVIVGVRIDREPTHSCTYALRIQNFLSSLTV
jgi:hypothetical protein